MSTHGDVEQDIHPSIEVDEEDYKHERAPSPHPRGRDGDESSSQHEVTDEDVFTDKSPRSSMGSYDASSESGKRLDTDNMTTITRSPRISDISQYDRDEEYVPTTRGTPRPPFRTPSDVRAMQMSSPTSSVVGSPRSARKHFPTVSRLGTPSASAQYSPKRKSTPPRFKSRPEAPLVLLHVTLLPLRWMWGELVNNLDPAELSEQAKSLRDSWRVLQDRVGDTVIERGILLGHPQNDYEVLEERLLEALDLPVRRRARILECGHYLGPSNEPILTEGEESEDDDGQDRRQSSSKRRWCGTCKSEIRYDPLGDAKIYRVKVYASNGLMRAGAWEACWKEMERVDVELEPIVEPSIQDEIVRLAAAQQEGEISQHEEVEIAKEVAAQYEERRQSEERLFSQARTRARMSTSPAPPHQPERGRGEMPDLAHERLRSFDRRQRDEERLREIYGESPPPPEPASRATSFQRPGPFVPPASPRSPPGEAKECRDQPKKEYQSASLPGLLLRSARVLVQDRKNIVIATLSVFVLFLALRHAPPTTSYEASFQGLQVAPEMQQSLVVDTASAVPYVEVTQSVAEEPTIATLSSGKAQDGSSEASVRFEKEDSPNDVPSAIGSIEISESIATTEEIAVSEPMDVSNEPEKDTTLQQAEKPFASSSGTPNNYSPCKPAAKPSPSVEAPACSAETEVDLEPEADVLTVEEVETATVMEKTVIKVVRTVTQTQTQTETETQTEVETATAFQTVLVKPTETPTSGCPTSTVAELLPLPTQSVLPDAEALECDAVEQEPVVDSADAFEPESEVQSMVEPEVENEVEPELETESESESRPEFESVMESTAEPTAEPFDDPQCDPDVDYPEYDYDIADL
ncbi:hypothetical protein GGS20DRAFT_452017 [Poronia punctata]|nr:hypothetical protein GGS20DRAFT_452017 [Poronia punctata]